ncbi:unnamed protein product, partial [Amoebophrya sp. A25]|eukprot:GSA25T00013654001.1
MTAFDWSGWSATRDGGRRRGAGGGDGVDLKSLFSNDRWRAQNRIRTRDLSEEIFGRGNKHSAAVVVRSHEPQHLTQSAGPKLRRGGGAEVPGAFAGDYAADASFLHMVGGAFNQDAFLDHGFGAGTSRSIFGGSSRTLVRGHRGILSNVDAIQRKYFFVSSQRNLATGEQHASQQGARTRFESAADRFDAEVFTTPGILGVKEAFPIEESFIKSQHAKAPDSSSADEWECFHDGHIKDIVAEMFERPRQGLMEWSAFGEGDPRGLKDGHDQIGDTDTTPAFDRAVRAAGTPACWEDSAEHAGNSSTLSADPRRPPPASEQGNKLAAFLTKKPPLPSKKR